ncbi:insulin receptor-like [Lycorma delicatula]|uniref:insulin receptor-like n=1 Tax=Lycorma delicatula TaxID=130591 RepID=UPI003F519BE4
MSGFINSLIIVIVISLTWVGTAESRTCKSMDVRNSVENAEKQLRGCQVIEGFLYVVLIGQGNETGFDKLSFPELREITGYLLLYRVNGLRSVGQLFPNLAVIGGNVLFMDYALIIFELSHLQEVGLYSLTTISRGSVCIVKNPNLCYVNTVEWDLIAEKGSNYKIDNKPLCPSCESRCKDKGCWNSSTCQMSNERNKCNELCLGGCSGSTNKDCYVCSGVLVDGNRCERSCPSGTYKYFNRRCITAKECVNETLQNPLADIDEKVNFWVFNDSCVHECPPGYEKDASGCIKCQKHCKECPSGGINSISDAARFRGCTYINGSLEISIKSGKHKTIQQELENGLSSVEEIKGYLKIARSYPITSLNFFKNLHVIHGNSLDNKNNALVILENENLQELWDWDSRPSGSTIQILNGGLFFHYNPKLCMSEINNFVNRLNNSNHKIIDLYSESNGDQYACRSFNLTVRVVKRHNQNIIIVIDRPQNISLHPSLLRYIVYYIESPEKNMTFDEPDQCGDNGWKTKDLPPENKFYDGRYHILTGLKPDTQYAFYVKTYTVKQEGGQSDLQYVRTLPSKPTFPNDLQGYSSSSSEITLNWQPPSELNGKLEKYIIIGFRQNIDEKFLLERNFCMTPMEFSHSLATTTVLPLILSKSYDSGNCSCNEKFTNFKDKDSLKEFCTINYSKSNQIFSVNDLQNCEKYAYTMLHTGIINSNHDPFGSNDFENHDDKPNFSQKIANKFPKIKEDELVGDTLGPYYHNSNYIEYDEFERIKNFVRHTNLTTIKIDNLFHFTEYSFEVHACRKIDIEESTTSKKLVNRCSDASIITIRTQKKPEADIIPKPVTHNVNNKTVEISWTKPSNPNGLVVNYFIEYRRTDISNSKRTLDCITPEEYNMNKKKGYGYKIQNLLPGKYSFRVQAVSMADEGKFTELVHFQIKEDFIISGEIIVSFLIIIIMTAICIIAFTIYWRKKSLAQNPSLTLIATVNPEYSSVKYVEDEWEIPRSDVQILNELGQGTFGMVYEGILKPDNISCAIKTVNDSATEHDYYEFLNEAAVMKSFHKAHHVVRLLGVVSKGTPPLVVMELMALGDLKSYLRKARESCNHPPPPRKIILLMAAQIADGMAYLEAKKFIHRDLAARNCMVAEDLTVKVGDFGMTRDIYETDYYRKGNKGLLPIRWMAPESLNDGVFTSQSDVWSYGVVLWEMANLAEQPYQGLANEQVLQFVINGNKLEPPLFSPEALKPIMVACWRWKPKNRPTFFQIVDQLKSHTNEQFARVSYYHSAEATEARQLLKLSKSEQKFSVFPRSVHQEVRLNSVPLHFHLLL